MIFLRAFLLLLDAQLRELALICGDAEKRCLHNFFFLIQPAIVPRTIQVLVKF